MTYYRGFVKMRYYKESDQFQCDCGAIFSGRYASENIATHDNVTGPVCPECFNIGVDSTPVEKDGVQ